MKTIEKILGVNPSELETKKEFDRRNLSMSKYEIIIENTKAGKAVFRVHGFQSTVSRTPELALMKYMITTNENCDEE